MLKAKLKNKCNDGRQKTHRNDCEQSWEGDQKTRRGWDRWLTNMHEKQQKQQWRRNKKNGRLERKRRRTTQTSHQWWRCSAASEKNWDRKQRRQQQQRKEAWRKGMRKQHSEQNEALCHEQNGERKKDMCPRSTEEKDTTQQTKKWLLSFFKKHEINALKWKNGRIGEWTRRLQIGRT